MHGSQIEDIKETIAMTGLGQILMEKGIGMTSLITRLTTDDHMEDLKRIGSEPEYRKELFQEYNL